MQYMTLEKIYSYKKYTYLELISMSDIVFRLLRKKIKKRNKIKLGSKKSNKIDRKLKNKRHPYGSSFVKRSTNELVRCMKPFHSSEILDSLNRKRDIKNWLHGNKRKKTINDVMSINNFSFIDNPENTLEYFSKLAEYEPYVKELTINFSDDSVLDIAPYLLFGIIQKDMYPFISGGKIKSGITHVIEKLTLDKFMGIEVEPHYINPNVNALPLAYKPVRDQSCKIAVTTLEVEVTRLIQKIDEWLSKLEHPMMLTDEGKVYVQTFSSEILDNAQRHSIKDKEGNWYMAGFMEHRDDKYSCCLSFVNTGEPIYRTIMNTENKDVAEDLHSYLNKHKNINDSILATVFALQDGSTRQNYNGSKGGVGMMKMVKFVNEIGETEDDFKPVIAILTGNAYIKFSDDYRNVQNNSKGQHIQWFNDTQSADFPPDKKHAFLLKNYFPGTIITTRFLLDDKTLRKKLKNDIN